MRYDELVKEEVEVEIYYVSISKCCDFQGLHESSQSTVPFIGIDHISSQFYPSEDIKLSSQCGPSGDFVVITVKEE